MAVEPTSLVVCLHGLGGDGTQFAIIQDVMRSALPGVSLAMPNAAMPADGGGGFQWFSIGGITPENTPLRLAEARASLDDLLTRVIAQRGFAERLDRVVLLGFSQGAVMVLDAAASGRWPVAAVVSFAGRLVTPDPLTPPAGLRALMIHGQDDPVILPHYTDEACARLRVRGVEVQRHMLPHVGHGVTPEGAYIALRFLAAVLGR